MDFKGFKKTAQDKDSVTMTHEKGHSMKIALRSLDKKQREGLIKLPLHKAEGGYTNSSNESGILKENYKKKKLKLAEGGDAEDSSFEERLSALRDETKPEMVIEPIEQPKEQKQPITINVGQPSAQQPLYVSEPNVQAQSKEQLQSLQPTQNEQASINESGPVAPAPASQPLTEEESNKKTAIEPIQNGMTPEESAQIQKDAIQEANIVNESQPSLPKTQEEYIQEKKAEVLKDLDQEDLAWQEDLKNGHIKPKTLHDLYAEKSTPGKIGMIFTLAISGFASGLTGQPDAYMGLLQKQIDNDLAAQKESKSNAYNFVNLARQQEMDRADIKYKLQQGELTLAQAKNIIQEANIKADALATSMAYRSSFHKLVEETNRLPDGPAKQKANQMLGLVYQQLGNHIRNVNDMAAGALAHYSVLYGNNQSNSSEGSEAAFRQKMDSLRMQGPEGQARAKDLEEKHIPGVNGLASIPLTADDRKEIDAVRSFDQQINRFIDWTSKHSGSLDPKIIKEGQALAAALQGEFRQATKGGVYKSGEQEFISNIITSNPTQFFNSIRALPQLKGIARENKEKLNNLLKNKGFSGYDALASKSAGNTNSSSLTEEKKSSNNEKTIKLKDGRTAIMINGKWVYK